MDNKKTLLDILEARPEDAKSLRWRTAVPLCTNFFLMLELLQFALVGAAVVLLTLCAGVWFTEGGIGVEDVKNSFGAAAVVLLGIVGGFVGVSVLFFGNRYFVTYQMDSDGIYHEGTRGRDERTSSLCLRMRPFPVLGSLTASLTRSRYLTWDKVDRFQKFDPMRVVTLSRGRWHMLRMYMPDAATYELVTDFLGSMFPAKGVRSIASRSE